MKTKSSKKLKPITPLSIASKKLKDLELAVLHQSTRIVPDLLKDLKALLLPLDDYLIAHSNRPSKSLQKLEKATNEIDWEDAFTNGQTQLQLEPEMLSGVLEGQFLKMLIAIAQAKNVLEIGSFTGYASLAMAEALPKDGQLLACEFDPYTAQKAREFLDESPVGHKIELKVGDARKTLEELHQSNKIFDFVFLDADKQGYLYYFKYILDNEMLNIGGIMIVDNTFLKGQAYQSVPDNEDAKAIQNFNKKVCDDPRVEQVMLPLRDGITLIRRIE
ncbi:class I SAM-dependent methyltransferase [Aquimarina sp. U1-2]|uniref:O-methyltransferase n=1 Tax=Aquimarina sp. U1-2 TaxID=2823141 RepID=UPI001AECB835|nr:class I SAM-dependent methyltransferase [Aquimarina sp. U1-2]MBP2832037.1 class I SAM-dependent methyltransferase [Aquimarina sp. U1-2]